MPTAASSPANDHSPSTCGEDSKQQSANYCQRCGQSGANQVADEFICDDCYIACGSCCAGEDD